MVSPHSRGLSGPARGALCPPAVLVCLILAWMAGLPAGAVYLPPLGRRPAPAAAASGRFAAPASSDDKTGQDRAAWSTSAGAWAHHSSHTVTRPLDRALSDQGAAAAPSGPAQGDADAEGAGGGLNSSTTSSQAPVRASRKLGCCDCKGTDTWKNLCRDCPSGKFNADTSGGCDNCPCGRHTNGGKGKASCDFKCQPPNKGTGGAGGCGSCKTGSLTSYQDSAGQCSCKSCPSGRIANSAGTGCKDHCPAGQHSVSFVLCLDCEAGKASSSGSTSCSECPAGEYAVSQKLPCKTCPKGYWCPGDLSKSICSGRDVFCPEGSTEEKDVPDGQYSTGANWAGNGAWDTEWCKAGNKCTGGKSSQCPAGRYAPARASACDICKTRAVYCPAGSGTETPVPSGQYSTKQLSGDDGAKDTEWCEEGHSCSGGVKSPCGAGYYAAARAATCSPCDSGSSSGAKASTCAPCAAGRWQKDKAQGSCDPCGAVTKYCPSGSKQQQAVKPGHYSTPENDATEKLRSGQSKCTKKWYCSGGKRAPCQKGKYSDEGGWTSCKPCPSAKYQPSTGQSGCLPCPSGRYTQTRDASGAITQHFPGSDTCKAAEAGTYATGGVRRPCGGVHVYCAGTTKTVAQDAPVAVDVGYYSTPEGDAYKTVRSGQVICPLGWRCESNPDGKASAGLRKACAKGRFAAETGQVECALCKPGRHQDVTTQASCKACPKGRWTDVDETVTCAPCAIGRYQSSEGQTDCIHCPRNVYGASEALETPHCTNVCAHGRWGDEMQTAGSCSGPCDAACEGCTGPLPSQCKECTGPGPVFPTAYLSSALDFGGDYFKEPGVAWRMDVLGPEQTRIVTCSACTSCGLQQYDKSALGWPDADFGCAVGHDDAGSLTRVQWYTNREVKPQAPPWHKEAYDWPPDRVCPACDESCDQCNHGSPWDCKKCATGGGFFDRGEGKCVQCYGAGPLGADVCWFGGDGRFYPQEAGKESVERWDDKGRWLATDAAGATTTTVDLHNTWTGGILPTAALNVHIVRTVGSTTIVSSRSGSLLDEARNLRIESRKPEACALNALRKCGDAGTTGGAHPERAPVVRLQVSGHLIVGDLGCGRLGADLKMRPCARPCVALPGCRGQTLACTRTGGKHMPGDWCDVKCGDSPLKVDPDTAVCGPDQTWRFGFRLKDFDAARTAFSARFAQFVADTNAGKVGTEAQALLEGVFDQLEVGPGISGIAAPSMPRPVCHPECLIDGVVYAYGARHPEHRCLTCDDAGSRTRWTVGLPSCRSHRCPTDLQSGCGRGEFRCPPLLDAGRYRSATRRTGTDMGPYEVQDVDRSTKASVAFNSYDGYESGAVAATTRFTAVREDCVRLPADWADNVNPHATLAWGGKCQG